MDFVTLLQKNKGQLGLAVFGFLLIAVGLVKMLSLGKGESVEVIPAEEATEQKVSNVVVVDVAGAIEQPGVYRLDGDVRVSDVLVAAGGLSSQADRGWVARNLNQAQVAVDGMKLYVPFIGEQGSIELTSSGGNTLGSNMVSINQASKEELMGLTQVGEVRAQAIIDNRPYQSLAEVISRAGVPQSVIDKNKDRVGL